MQATGSAGRLEGEDPVCIAKPGQGLTAAVHLQRVLWQAALVNAHRFPAKNVWTGGKEDKLCKDWHVQPCSACRTCHFCRWAHAHLNLQSWLLRHHCACTSMPGLPILLLCRLPGLDYMSTLCSVPLYC